MGLSIRPCSELNDNNTKKIMQNYKMDKVSLGMPSNFFLDPLHQILFQVLGTLMTHYKLLYVKLHGIGDIYLRINIFK